ncbi:MAG: 4Fe-4S ferredoxin [Deltaproteobacteria bacterium]|nr:4Fe-4S ferredoxin [Deltaproteobacteria bacterium]
MRRAMMIDLDKCVGCQACVTSCKERWDSGPGAARNWVHEYENEGNEGVLGITFYPGLCMQCKDHPCTEDCPTGATYMDEKTGIVMVDPDVCIGCGNCVSMCAYGARNVDDVKGIVEKCNLCAPYVARGEQPACVATCLAGCRHFGDPDDSNGKFAQLVRKTGARPLVTEDVDIGPKVTYAGDDHRGELLSHGVVARPRESRLTRLWSGVTRPFASYFAPVVMGATVLGGLLVNFKSRKDQLAKKNAPGHKPKTLKRHRPGMRFLHWFNALSWVLLLVTGIALISAKSFALFGQDFPRWVSDLFGGAAPLIRFHAVWGIAWALIIVPVFLVYKRGGLEAIEELKLSLDDFRWLREKPFSLLGFSKKPLPDQDKYNAGQKLFAMAVMAGTTAIIGTGVIMTFHMGSAEIVAASIVVHKLAVVVTLVGVAVHVTMAAILREERPALTSMIVGDVDREHAAHHSAKWVREMEATASRGKQ